MELVIYNAIYQYNSKLYIFNLKTTHNYNPSMKVVKWKNREGLQPSCQEPVLGVLNVTAGAEDVISGVLVAPGMEEFSGVELAGGGGGYWS